MLRWTSSNFAGDTSHFLRPASGRASLNLLQVAREGLLMDLRSAITQAQKTGGHVNREGVRLRFEGKSLSVTVRVIPLRLPAPPTSHYVILIPMLDLEPLILEAIASVGIKEHDV